MPAVLFPLLAQKVRHGVCTTLAIRKGVVELGSRCKVCNKPTVLSHMLASIVLSLRGQQGGTAEGGNPRGPVTKFEDTRAPKTKFVEAKWVRGGVRDIRAFAEKSAISRRYKTSGNTNGLLENTCLMPKD